MQVYETAGDSLAGAVDGSNRIFVTSLPFDADSVQVFINGLSKSPSLQDGFVLEPPNRIVINEAREAGDTVAVAYTLAGEGSLGGQLGGVPPGMSYGAIMPPQTVSLSANAPEQPTLSLRSPPLGGC
jgi:hypothetical protein